MFSQILYQLDNPWELFVLFLFLILFLILFGEFGYKKKILSASSNRAIIHLFTGLAVSSSPFLFPNKIQPIILAFLFLFINLISYKNNKLNSFHDIGRESLGTIYFPLSFILICGLFWDYSYQIAASYIILAVADPLASFVGNRKRSVHKYNIAGDIKSIEGSAAMFTTTLVLMTLVSRFIFIDFDILNTTIAIIICSIAITFSESISFKGSDNLTIPITAFLFIELFNHLNQNNFLSEFLFIIILIFIFLFYFFRKKQLSLSGFISANFMGTLIVGFGGLDHLIPISIFFISSTILSKFNNHQTMNLESNRNAAQVFANGGLALLLCIINHFYPNNFLYYSFIAAIAAANSDTWGTEIGKFSKTNPIDIISRKKLETGESGGVTAMGIVGSLLGSLLISLTGYLFKIDVKYLMMIFMSGFFASLFDSIIGSSFQSRFISKSGLIISESYIKNYYLFTGDKRLNNDAVNFLCTVSSPLFLITIDTVL